MTLTILALILGLVLLIKGGDWLVDGAAALARRAHLSPMLIGITIVAFGTSAPELLVSLRAALGGSAGLALGNVVGSNIVNIALILGITALLAPTPTQRVTLKVDMPVLLATSLLLALAAMSGSISRSEGLIALALLAVYIGGRVRKARGQTDQTDQTNLTNQTSQTGQTNQTNQTSPTPEPSAYVTWLWVIAGCLALALGAHWLVGGATALARAVGHALGADPADVERIIGLTIVAVGTSLPELTASVTAARRGETDMAIGNVIGSNIFNILCVAGASAAICPIADSDRGFLGDYLWMIALTALLWLFMRTHRRLSRAEGAALTTLYVIYLALTLVNCG